MNNYNFWADLLFTFQSSPDWIKALWLLVPPAFLLAATVIMIWFRLAVRREKTTEPGQTRLLRSPDNAVPALDNFAVFQSDFETLSRMLRTPLCPVVHLPYEEGDVAK